MAKFWYGRRPIRGLGGGRGEHSQELGCWLCAVELGCWHCQHRLTLSCVVGCCPVLSGTCQAPSTSCTRSPTAWTSSSRCPSAFVATRTSAASAVTASSPFSVSRTPPSHITRTSHSGRKGLLRSPPPAPSPLHSDLFLSWSSLLPCFVCRRRVRHCGPWLRGGRAQGLHGLGTLRRPRTPHHTTPHNTTPHHGLHTTPRRTTTPRQSACVRVRLLSVGRCQLSLGTTTYARWLHSATSCPWLQSFCPSVCCTTRANAANVGLAWQRCRRAFTLAADTKHHPLAGVQPRPARPWL